MVLNTKKIRRENRRKKKKLMRMGKTLNAEIR